MNAPLADFGNLSNVSSLFNVQTFQRLYSLVSSASPEKYLRGPPEASDAALALDAMAPKWIPAEESKRTRFVREPSYRAGSQAPLPIAE